MSQNPTPSTYEDDLAAMSAEEARLQSLSYDDFCTEIRSNLQIPNFADSDVWDDLAISQHLLPTFYERFKESGADELLIEILSITDSQGTRIVDTDKFNQTVITTVQYLAYSGSESAKQALLAVSDYYDETRSIGVPDRNLIRVPRYFENFVIHALENIVYGPMSWQNSREPIRSHFEAQERKNRLLKHES